MIAHELASGEYVTFRDHWQGFRRYARPAAVARGRRGPQ